MSRRFVDINGSSHAQDVDHAHIPLAHRPCSYGAHLITPYLIMLTANIVQAILLEATLSYLRVA